MPQFNGRAERFLKQVERRGIEVVIWDEGGKWKQGRNQADKAAKEGFMKKICQSPAFRSSPTFTYTHA
jgi:hypothetical protein